MRMRSVSTRRPRNKPGSAGPPRGVLGAMPPEEVARVVERACGSKERFVGPGGARRAARRVSAATRERVRAYRCPFGDGTRHWHIGHVPSMAGLGRLALAIRVRAQQADGPAAPQDQ
jgi:hypothetical protein